MRRRRPAFRGRFEERAGLLPPAGREAFFLAPFRARARKEPRRGVDGPPALFEKGMLIDAQEHRDVLVPHSLRLINHKITEKEKRDNLGRRGIYFWQECNFVAEYVIEKEWGAPPF